MMNANRLIGAGVIGLSCTTSSASVNSFKEIATGLTRYGREQRQSQCVGDRLQANLSIGQLQQLGRAARAVNKNDTTPGRLTISDLIRVSQFNDARVSIEVTKVAAGCGVLTEAAPAP